MSNKKQRTTAEKKVDDLNKEVKRLNKVIREKDKTIRNLKSEKKQAMDRFIDSEVYLREVTNGRPLSEIMKTVKNGEPLGKNEYRCPKCNASDISVLIYTGFHIKICKCCLLYTSPSPRDRQKSRMPSSA